MHAYLYQIHNLSDNNDFLRLDPDTKSAIISYLTDSLGDLNNLENIIVNESSHEVLNYIHQNLDLKKYSESIIFTTNRRSYIDNVDFNNVRAIIDFKRINNVQKINDLFKAVNALLPDGGIYIGRLETCFERKLKIYRFFGQKLGRFVWMLDFAVNRVIPRIPYLESVYYQLTGGEFHAISKAEILGRIVFNGFEIVDFSIIKGLSYFVAMKTRLPYEYKNPSYYPIIRLQRIGQDGRIIGVYKFRTMHPYSEYIQDYIIKLNGYNSKGKPASDFRITRWGKFFRTLWIDEWPQIINVLKGEMKLVGLRPLSLVRYKEFPQDLQLERIKYKPGCIPPYVSLNMPDDKMNIEAERIYLKDLSKHPLLTDLRYMLKAVYNILTNKIRSA